MRLHAGISAAILTRSPKTFASHVPHLVNHRAFSFVHGDVRAIPDRIGMVDAFIHAATPASANLNQAQPMVMLETIVEGGRCALEAAARSGQIPFLFTSSGAVYGKQPPGMTHMPESYPGAPDSLSALTAYHEGKRIGELQCALYAQACGLRPKIARLFAFVGPYLPLDRHFAIGNFIRDGLQGKTIVVGGDGTTIRSYLYAADMVNWLWAIFARGESLRAYNVGSEEAVDIASLARLTASCFTPQPSVEVRSTPAPGAVADCYVPSTRRIQEELKVRAIVPLRQAIERTISFHRQTAQPNSLAKR